MTWLTLRLLVGGERLRTVLVVACTAAVTTLLLVALTLLLLPEVADEALYEVVADAGTRGGVVLAVLLLVVPPLLLARQAVRFGTAARERRLAGLRVAGATPGDVRRLGALEVGLPALAGGALGVLGFVVLRAVAGGTPTAPQPGGPCGTTDDGGLTVTAADCGWSGAVGGLGQLVPRTVEPSWWMLLLVVLAVSAAGAVVGGRIGAQVALSPHGVVRRRPSSPPRPWGLLVLVGAVVAVPLALATYSWADGLGIFVLIAAAMLGVVSLGPWVAYRSGRRVLARTARPAALLAASRLLTDPRPAGRAASAVGGIGLAAGGSLGFLLDLITADQAEAYYLVPLGLVAGCLLVGLTVVCGTVAVHAVESLGDRRRSVAAQVAQGVPVDVLERSLRWEAGLVAVPLGVLGGVLGALTMGGASLYAPAVGDVVVLVLLAAVAGVVMATLTLLAVVLTVRLVRPALRSAVRPENLRTA